MCLNSSMQCLHFCIKYRCNMACHYKINVSGGGGGGGEGDLKQSINYRLKDFSVFVNNLQLINNN